MIREVIRQTMRPDIAERALAWLDRVDTLLAVLRREMPGYCEGDRTRTVAPF
jgi:antibiotic biosynthesis monooxygenase (ABM) superfamily enzyme